MHFSRKFSKRFLILSLIIFNSSCAFLNIKKPMTVPDALKSGVTADVKSFFDGDIEAFAVRFDKDNKIISSRIIKVNGSWEEGKGIIRQQFVDDKKEKDSRTWLVTVENGKNFSAIGHDIVSPAKGVQNGNVIYMTYSLSKANDDLQKNITDYEDKMFMVDQNSMIMITNLFVKGRSIGHEIVSLTKVDKKSDIENKSVSDDTPAKKLFTPMIKSANSDN